MSKKPTTRDEIAALRNELAHLEQRPADAASIRKAITAAVRLRQSEFDEWAEWKAKHIARDPADGAREAFATAIPSNPAWAHRAVFGLLADRLIDDLVARATAASADIGEPINPAERTRQALALRRRMYALELQDVAESLAAGIPFRPDVNPAAVLGAPVDEAEAAGLL